MEYRNFGGQLHVPSITSRSACHHGVYGWRECAVKWSTSHLLLNFLLPELSLLSSEPGIDKVKWLHLHRGITNSYALPKINLDKPC